MAMRQSTLDRQKQAWKLFVKHDCYLRKDLKIDSPICDVLLSNPHIYKNMRIKTIRIQRVPGDKYRRDFFSLIVSGKRISTRLVGYSNYPARANYCFGERRHQGYFAHEVSKMKYLSEFLATFPSFIMRRV